MNDQTYHDYLRYDSITGKFFRRVKMHRWAAGTESGSALSTGHISISLFGKSISARKLAWYMHYGHWPDGEVVSANGVVDDLRICNLQILQSVELTQESLHAYCSYSEGKLYRKRPTKGSQNVAIGSVGANGYLETSVYGKRHLVHRLVWLFHYGTSPLMVDHINRNRFDNRIENLRAADYLTNAWNTTTPCRTGLPTGVDKHGEKYRARVKADGKVHIEMLDTPNEAGAAYLRMKKALCKEWTPE